MAADAYLKAAAAQLQNAAQAIKSEIDGLRSQARNTESQLKHEIDHKESEMRAALTHTMFNGDSDADSHLAVEAARLKHDAESKKREIQDMQNQINQTIRAKESVMNDLINEAKSLQNKAGNPALR